MYKPKNQRLYLDQEAFRILKNASKRKEVFMNIFKLLKKKPTTTLDILKAEVDLTKAELETAYSHFENVVDPDLISSSIYHINSIQERYKYLMKLIK